MNKVQRKYETGLALEDSERPRVAYGSYRDLRIRKLLHFFKINAFIVVSAAFAEVIGRFDLGDGGLYPIELWQNNRVERVPDDWYLLGFGCQKRAFLPKRSAGGVTGSDLWPEGKWMATNPKDREVAVSASALEGCDLWVAPPLHSAFFVTGRLEAALKGAGLTRNIRRARRIVVAGVGMDNVTPTSIAAGRAA